MFRTLTIARRRRHWNPPAGTTHVLTHTPGWLIEGGEPAEGAWAVESLASFFAGDSDVTGCFVGPADPGEDTLYAFMWNGVELSRFEFEVSDDTRSETAPAYWVIQA